MSEDFPQKFYADDVSLPKFGLRANSVDANFSCNRINGKHYPDLGSNTSSVCNLRCYFVGRLVVA